MPENSKISAVPFLVIGLLVAASLAFLKQQQVVNQLIYVWIGFYGLMFLLAYPSANSLVRLCVVTPVFSYFASVPIVWQLQNNYIPFTAFLVILANACAWNAFHVAYQENQRTLAYESLFSAVYDAVIKLIVACFFAGICWFIIILWGNLFESLGIHFFARLFAKNWFGIGSASFFFAVGLLIATQTHLIVHYAKMISALIMYYLFPVLAVIGIAFLASAGVVFLTKNSAMTLAPNSFLLLALLSVVFANGVFFQPEQMKNPYAPVLRWVLIIFLMITPIFTAIALYHIIQTIFKHGLHFAILSELVTAVLLFLYNVCYAYLMVLSESRWFSCVKKINISLAIFLMLLSFAAYNPWIMEKMSKQSAASVSQCHCVE